MKPYKLKNACIMAERYLTGGDETKAPEGAMIQLTNKGNYFAYVDTPKGRKILRDGDWVLKDYLDQYFIVSNDEFERNYESV